MDSSSVKSEDSIGNKKNNKDEFEETLRLCLVMASKFCKVVLTKNDTLETAAIDGRLTIDAHSYMKEEEDKAERKKRKMKIKNIEMNLKKHVDSASKTQRYKIATILAYGQDVQIESEELTKAKQRVATLENELRLTSVKVEIRDEPMAVDNSIKSDEKDSFECYDFEEIKDEHMAVDNSIKSEEKDSVEYYDFEDVQIESEELTMANQRIATLETELRLMSERLAESLQETATVKTRLRNVEARIANVPLRFLKATVRSLESRIEERMNKWKKTTSLRMRLQKNAEGIWSLASHK